METPPAKRQREDKQSETIKQLQNRIANLKGAGKAANREVQPKAKAGKQKGAGKGRSQIKMPRELVDFGDCAALDESGEPLCFNFQLGGCDQAAAGERCPKGWHKCAKIGCNAAHGRRSHA